MDFFTAFDISSSALTAQRTRMNIISSNLANIYSTESYEGGPYRRRDVVFSAEALEGREFNRVLRDTLHSVHVTDVIEDQRPFKSVYDPYHPNADKNGYVYYPNVNVMEEMVNMMAATRSYEANVNVLRTTKGMIQKALEIGK